MKMMDGKIYVAGHRGLVGSALMRRLAAAGRKNIITRTRAELDLRDQAATEAFFAAERPDYVLLAAAKVGGIVANDRYPADFCLDNLRIEANVIDAARRHGCRKFLFLGSSCIYPKFCPQPMKEADLLTGPLEPTNAPFALAKLAGISLGQSCRRQYGFDFVAVLPGNLYGPGDNFDPEAAHVLPALLRRFHEAKLEGREEVAIWGSGSPMREFLHVDDLAGACLFVLKHYSGLEPINIGSGFEISMLDLAGRVAGAVGFEGKILTDPSKPDGTPRKLLDGSRLAALGWRPRINFDQGLADTYAWYLERQEAGNFRK